MVARQTSIGGSQGLIVALVVPRPLSRILLLLFCLSIAQAAWLFLDSKLLAFMSGQAVAACTLCLAAVWSFRGKTADILSSDDLSSDDLIMVQKAAKQLGAKAIRRAIWVGVCVLFAGGPAAAVQLSGYVIHWMVLLCGLGVAEAMYALWLTNHLTEQIREWRDVKKIEVREANELRNHVERLQNSAILNGWQAVENESAKTVVGELKQVH